MNILLVAFRMDHSGKSYSYGLPWTELLISHNPW
jgi:hypothetical protein